MALLVVVDDEHKGSSWVDTRPDSAQFSLSPPWELILKVMPLFRLAGRLGWLRTYATKTPPEIPSLISSKQPTGIERMRANIILRGVLH
jgi:hypothetical protein